MYNIQELIIFLLQIRAIYILLCIFRIIWYILLNTLIENMIKLLKTVRLKNRKIFHKYVF